MRLASVWCVNCIRPWSDPHAQKKTLYTVFAEIQINAACVSVRWAIFKLMCNRSLNNEVIRRRILRWHRAWFFIMAFCGAVAAISVQKNVWLQSRSQDWRDSYVRGFMDTEFIKISAWEGKRLKCICQRFSLSISRQDTHLRRPISVSKRVGVGLYWLATGSCYSTISNLFGIGKSTVCLIVHEFCKAFRHVLMPEYIILPQGGHLQEVIEGFPTEMGLPSVCRSNSWDSYSPEDNHADYFNCKEWPSVVLQGVVDHQFW